MPSASGNALFFILIGVALFAALSYAVTQSDRGGGNIDREKASIDAAILVQEAAKLSQGVLRFMTVNGISANALDLCDNANTTGGGWQCEAFGPPTFDVCTSGPACAFSADGGGLEQPRNLLSANLWRIEETRTIANVGTTATDAAAYVTVSSAEVCSALNRGLGLGAGILSDTDASGNFALAYPPDTLAACFTNNPTGAYFFYQVLVRR